MNEPPPIGAQNDRPRALVLGGGVAGITAALALARRFRVTLLEAHGRLGGRAFSMPDDRLGGERDNGAHVLLGCYGHFRRLLRQLGSEGAFLRQPTLQLAYADGTGRVSQLRLSRLPVPLAMPLALLRLRSLTTVERLRALLGLLGVLVGGRRRHHTVADWIAAWRQHGGPSRHLWEPLCHAVMNADPHAVSAPLFVRTLLGAFGGRASRAAIWLPERGWSEILGAPAERALGAAGVEVRLRARVRHLRADGGRVSTVEGEGFAPIALGPSDQVVSALPWHRLAACLPAGDPVAARAASLQGRAIVCVYFALAHDPPLPDAPLVALLGGTPFHFLVRRPSDQKRRFALLAAGTPAVEALRAPELIEAACAQLARHFPGTKADPRRARVAKEAHATLLASPAAEPLRPACGLHPTLGNLHLAGDWCATGLPSTLEGAAWSGVAASAGC